jgi:methylenetetrahydrofolate dehydrogenase (NADP+)/methenyltetrahydrofolate cyclohydrolase
VGSRIKSGMTDEGNLGADIRGNDMSADIIDGKVFAAGLRAKLAAIVPGFVAATGRAPGLAVVLVGEDPASQVYVRSKGKATREAGMESFEYKLPATASQDAILKVVKQLNADDTIDGILVQLPLPPHVNEDLIIATIDPDKDVDGFHVVNVGRLSTGLHGFVPCTPLGCIMLLKDRLGDLSGLDAVVVGRSNIVGKPMTQLLLAENCTVTVAHSRTKDLPAVVRRADIVVAAVGRPEMIRGDWIKPGATVIDVGINRVPATEPGKTKLVGDVAFAEAAEHAAAITPVPGGVGPMTIAVLLRNTLVAAHRRAGVPLAKGAI